MSRPAIRMIEDGVKHAVPSWMLEELGRFVDEADARRLSASLSRLVPDIRVARLRRRTMRKWIVYRIRLRS